MVSFSQGYLVLGNKVPFRFHWSVPIGALVLGGFEVRPWFWLSFFVLVLGHELGHALIAWRYKMRVVAIDMTAIGGVCHYVGSPTPLESAAIAWGGVLAQLAILIVTFILGRISPPERVWSLELYGAFTSWNLLIMGINLIPIPPFDGAKAWQWFVLRAKQRGRGPTSWNGRRKQVAARAKDERDGQVIDFEWARSRREKKAVDAVDDQIREIVERAHREHSQKKNPTKH